MYACSVTNISDLLQLSFLSFSVSSLMMEGMKGHCSNYKEATHEGGNIPLPNSHESISRYQFLESVEISGMKCGLLVCQRKMQK